jgi:serpin B
MAAPSALNQFALKLYSQMSAGKAENFFISPFSISTAMAMCLAGARNETATQLKQLLNVADLSDNEILELNHSYVDTVSNSLGADIKISTANKIYPHAGFQIHQAFLDTLAKYFHSTAQPLDYKNGAEAAKTINSWVAEQTANKIQNLIDPSALNDLVRLVLVNAIYFKGNWLEPFKAQSTGKEPFNLSDGSVKEVDMMRMANKKFKHLSSPGGIKADTVELPYEGNTISMTIVLPQKGHSLSEVETQLTAQVLHEVLTAPYSSSGADKDPVILHVPKFKMEYKQEVT